MKFTIITNNPVFKDYNMYPVEFVDGSYLEVLVRVRDKIHLGYSLLSHPLSGSVKPGDTPYKSILISQKCDKLDKDSLLLIEEAIGVCKKLGPAKQDRAEKYSDDYSVIDRTLIESAIESAVQVCD